MSLSKNKIFVDCEHLCLLVVMMFCSEPYLLELYMFHRSLYSDNGAIIINMTPHIHKITLRIRYVKVWGLGCCVVLRARLTKHRHTAASQYNAPLYTRSLHTSTILHVSSLMFIC